MTPMRSIILWLLTVCNLQLPATVELQIFKIYTYFIIIALFLKIIVHYNLKVTVNYQRCIIYRNKNHKILSILCHGSNNFKTHEK